MARSGGHVLTAEICFETPLRLRSTLAALTTLVTALALLVSGALVALTTILRGHGQHVAELFDGASPEHSIEVRLPSHPVSVRCDQLRIEQVITNLISNAIKYSPAGGAVEVTLEPRYGEVELSVTDHGIGISEEDRARVFDPFQRVGLSKGNVPGVGLGLFVVRKLVLSHGGQIDIESRRGVGSTFRVCLPLASRRDDARDLLAASISGSAEARLY